MEACYCQAFNIAPSQDAKFPAAAHGDAPEPAIPALGQAWSSPPTPSTYLQWVYRELRYRDLQEAKALPEELS
jgi:hypothetical protein